MMGSTYRTRSFHKRWLKITAGLVGLFGPLFFLGTMSGSVEPIRWTLDLVSWPLDGGTTFEHPDTRFLSALAGGFLIGWAMMIWCLTLWVYDAAPEGVRKSVLFGLLAWFMVDSLGSVTSGNPSNVVFNTLLLLVLVGPLWRPAAEGER